MKTIVTLEKCYLVKLHYFINEIDSCLVQVMH